MKQELEDLPQKLSKEPIKKFLVVFENATWLLALPIFTLAILLTQFYSLGSYFLDSGWFDFSLCSSWGVNPPLDALFWGNNSIFGIHTFFSPVIGCRVLTLVTNNSFIGYSLLLSLGVFVAVFSGQLISQNLIRNRRQQKLFGFLFGLSGFSIGSISYPHPEAFGAAFTALGLILFLTNRSKFWTFPLLIGLLSREDMGIHLAITMSVLFIFIPQSENLLRKKAQKLALLGVGTTLTLLILQKAIWPTKRSVFNLTYAGTPPFEVLHHPHEVLMRISFWSQNNAGILGLFLILFIAFILSKKKLFLVPMISSIPWIAINILAADGAKQILGIYESFPFLIYLSILCVTNDFGVASSITMQDRDFSKIWLLMAMWLALFGSLVSGQTGSAGSLDFGLRSFKNLNTDFQFIEHNQKEIDRLLDSNPKIAIDPAIASIFPKYEGRILNFKNGGTYPGGVMFFKNYVLGSASIDAFRNLNQGVTLSCIDGGPIEFITSDVTIYKKLSGGGWVKC